MLSAQQAENGMPLISAHSYDINDTRYLQDITSSRSRVVGAVVHSMAPLLTWTGCETATATATDGNPSANADVDLEARANAITNTDDVLFADVSQNSVNMCTSMAFVHAYTLRYVLQKLPLPAPQLSAVYAYYFQRIQECMAFDVCKCTAGCGAGTCATPAACDPPCMDCGSYLASAASVFSRGVCTSTLWPYTVSINAEPDGAALASADQHRITAMACVPVGRPFLPSCVHWLATDVPVVVFLNLTPVQVTWMQARQNAYNVRVDGVFDTVLPPFVDQEDASLYVGHAVLVVGVRRRFFILRNNFGNAWGARGRFCIDTRFAATAQFHTAVAVSNVVGTLIRSSSAPAMSAPGV